MSEVWEPEDITAETVNQLFNDAYMVAEIDKDDDVAVRDSDLKLFVNVRKDGSSLVMSAAFSFDEASTELQRLTFVNRINSDLVLVRAFWLRDTLWLDYMLRTDAGTTKKTVVMALKFFSRMCTRVWRDGTDLDQVLER